MKFYLFLLLSVIMGYAQYNGNGCYGNYIPTEAPLCTKYFSSDANTLGLWIFDNTYATDPTIDYSGNSNTLTASGGFDYANQFTGSSIVCSGGTALAFDGTDDYFSTSIDASTTHTIEVIAKLGTPSGSYNQMIGADGDAYCLIIATWGQIYYRNNSNSVSVAWPYDTSNAHYFAAVRDGVSVSFYVDGSQVQTTQTLPGSASQTVDKIGGNSTAYFIGEINAVRISSTARTSTEILNYWNSIQ